MEGGEGRDRWVGIVNKRGWSLRGGLYDITNSCDYIIEDDDMMVMEKDSKKQRMERKRKISHNGDDDDEQDNNGIGKDNDQSIHVYPDYMYM